MFGCFPSFWSSNETPVRSAFQDTVGMEHRQELAQVTKTLRVLGSRLKSEKESSRTNWFQCKTQCENACKAGDLAFAKSKSVEMVRINARIKCITSLLRVFGETTQIIEDEQRPPQNSKEIKIALEGFVQAISKIERKLLVAKLVTLESIYQNLDTQEHPIFMKLLSKRPSPAAITEEERKAFETTVSKKAAQALEVIQGTKPVGGRVNEKKDSIKKD